MYQPRHIRTAHDWYDSDLLKLYTISTTATPVELTPYLACLAELKAARPAVSWSETPGFIICHEGASLRYLILAWWGNDNELFTVVAVQEPAGWVEDRERYSFCLFDLEVMWAERNIFIDTMYSGTRNLQQYRATRHES
ncbi:MAG: hypothetical protein KDI36_12520 [Pseudomonadales bacterium]|nr:hypothetical protein [Pseudomonadales bacterium]